MTTQANGSNHAPRRAARALLMGAFYRGAAMAALWWVFAEGAAESWLIGIPAVAAATTLSLVLAPPPLAALRPAGVAMFIPYFLRGSVLGGLDVARRALDPALPLKPGFVTVPLAGLPDKARLIFVVVVSLLPGTLSARLQEDRLRVHVLDRGMDVEGALARLRARIGAMFAETERDQP